jgi:hypothetical protein
MKTTLNSRIVRSAAGLLAAFAVSACSSPNPFIAHREQLADSFGKVSASQYGTAARELETVLAETNDDAKKFAVQRFYAMYLLTQAHMRASVKDSFLKEPAPTLARSGIGAASEGDSKQPSTVGHLVAAMMYASFAKDTYPAARGGQLVEKGEEVLPHELSGFDVETAQINLELCMLVVQAELGFESNVERTLDNSNEMWTDAGAIRLLDRTHFDTSLRPWVFYTLFDYLKTRNEPAAYRFGVLAMEHAGDANGTLGTKRTAGIIHWIKEGSHFVFKCPQCNSAAVPEMHACPTDQTPLIDFFAAERAPKPQ